MTTVEQEQTARSRVRSGLSARAERVRGGEDSPYIALLRLAAERPDTIRLARGEPDLPPPAHIVEAARQALADGHTGYTDPAGLPQLRAAIANKLERDNDLTYDPMTQIIVTSGAQEAMAVTLQTLIDPGDDVLIASPYYSAYEANIVLAGGNFVPVPTYEHENFELRPAAIEAQITPQTKLLILVSPNNPTAAVVQPSTVREIAELAQRRDLLVLSDELYERVVFDGFQPLSIASLPGMSDRTVVLNGFSKAYSMTGFRVGYLAGPADYIRAAVEPRHSFSISSPSPSQYAALAALTGPQDFIRESVAEYQARRDLMREAFDEMGVTYSLPKGGFYFFVNIKPAGLDAVSFCRRGIEEFGVLISPGDLYQKDGQGYLRVTFLADRATLAEGMKRFAALYESCVAATQDGR